jgi:Raf kinase inhibitor-like YbhB/YbcL family protein
MRSTPNLTAGLARCSLVLTVTCAALAVSGLSATDAAPKRRVRRSTTTAQPVAASRPAPTQTTATQTTATQTLVALTTPPSTPLDASVFALTSPAMVGGGSLPVEFSCDGASISPSLSWQGAPFGTVSYAVVMHHVAGPDDVHWYWVVYGIGPEIAHLDEGVPVPSPAHLGTNSVNGRNEYAPPCSQGPGAKQYTLTIYALSKSPTMPTSAPVNRDTLLSTIAATTLGSTAITVSYQRLGLPSPPPSRPRLTTTPPSR